MMYGSTLSFSGHPLRQQVMIAEQMGLILGISGTFLVSLSCWAGWFYEFSSILLLPPGVCCQCTLLRLKRLTVCLQYVNSFPLHVWWSSQSLPLVDGSKGFMVVHCQGAWFQAVVPMVSCLSWRGRYCLDVGWDLLAYPSGSQCFLFNLAVLPFSLHHWTGCIHNRPPSALTIFASELLPVSSMMHLPIAWLLSAGCREN